MLASIHHRNEDFSMTPQRRIASTQLYLFTLVGLLSLCVNSRAADDILIADFEGETYGDWKVTGEAFGPGPARGSLPNQMPVTGYKGKGLVNSYYGGDKSTGTLTSPPVQIERKYINFLIGGGHHPGETCINLRVGDKVVRTATGPNDQPGGGEHLDWHTWDVQEFAGKKAIIQIVDNHTGGWGHINIDHIIQSDRKLQAEPAQRELTVRGRYLHLPVKTGAPKRQMRFVVEGKTDREFEIELADDAPDFWVFSDVSAYKGQPLTVAVNALPGDSKGLAAITQGEEIRDAERFYKEKHRPQFHFTSRRGWLNDPNGLVCSKGEYHLFYQHNPFGWDWGNMHWGHAVSKDLVHWQELPIALYPQRFGDWCFSGSAVVDATSTSGFKQGDEDVLVAAYTSTGRGECIVYSNDRGRTWAEFAGNPVVKHAGRDPRLLWFEPTRQWVMAVYDETDGKRRIAFHTSPDLKKWQFQSQIDDFFECPDLFELPVDDNPKKKRWVLSAADGKYLVGDFDGKTFRPETGKQQFRYGNFYAAQTFSNTPDGRCIQIGWGNGITFPGMPFNQQMTIPCQLRLRTADNQLFLVAEPVKELDGLHTSRKTFAERMLKPGENPLAEITGELFDIQAEFEPGKAEALGFTLRGVPVVYDAIKQTLTCKQHTAPLQPRDGKVRLRLLLDRGSIEVFGNDGRVAMSAGAIAADDNRTIEVLARGGAARLRSLEVHEMRSAWAPR
jgi:fructan beta-fructosidase